MLTNPTLEQMQRLGLHGMVAAYRDLAEQANELGHEDWLALMLDREETVRADKRLANRLRAAKLRFPEACIEDIDFASGRGLDRRTVLSLAEGAWLKAHENIIVSGETGTGKTWLGCALGLQAARLDHSVLYVRISKLFEDLAKARLDGSRPRLVDKLARVQLLILDDWGTHTMNDSQRLDILDICEERYGRKSTLITAQAPVDKWHEDALIAALDRQPGPVVLVGHSAAGVVMQAAAPRAAGKVAALVFHNAFILGHGRSMIESIPPEIAEKFRADAAASPDNSLMVDADFVAAVLMAGADEETIDQTLADLVPQPFDYYTHRVDIRPFTRMTCPRYVLLAADDASLPRAAWLAMAENLGEHKVFEIPGGHEVLYTDPDSLARALAAIAHDLDAR